MKKLFRKSKRNRKQRILFLLNDWLVDAIRDKAWEIPDDIHIDEIDRIFKQKSEWLKGSLLIYPLLKKLSLSKGCSVFCAIVLPDGDDIAELKSMNLKDMAKLIDTGTVYTPPSFYIFQNNTGVDSLIKKSGKLEILSAESGYHVYYYQEQEGDIYSRWLYLFSD